MHEMFDLGSLNFLPQLHLSLKIYSMKKVVKKLQDAAATWVTNIVNDQGEVLISVVTEGLLSLKPMADGLMKRLVYSILMYCIVHLNIS